MKSGEKEVDTNKESDRTKFSNDLIYLLLSVGLWIWIYYFQDYHGGLENVSFLVEFLYYILPICSIIYAVSLCIELSKKLKRSNQKVYLKEHQ